MTATHSTTDPWVPAEAQTAPVVERVVTDDGHDYEVTLAIDPRDIVEPLLMALDRHRVRAVQVRHLPAGDPQRKQALGFILTDPAVAAALTVHLAGGMAEDLGHELDEASTAPEQCRIDSCDSYGEVDTDRGWLCLGHAASLEDYQGVDRDEWDEAI